MFQLISQITLCVMLLITTGWCIVVYRKLVTMKSDAGPIKDLIDNLNRAAKRADQTILAMRLVIKEADSRLEALGNVDRRVQTVSNQEAPDRSPRLGRRHEVLAEALRQARRAEDGAEANVIGVPHHAERDAPYVSAPYMDGPPPVGLGRGGLRQRRYEDSLPVHGSELEPESVLGRERRTLKQTPRRADSSSQEAEMANLARSIANLR